MGFFRLIKDKIVNWLDFGPKGLDYDPVQPSDYWPYATKIRQLAEERAAKRLVPPPDYEESRAERLKDNELSWPHKFEELTCPVSDPEADPYYYPDDVQVGKAKPRKNIYAKGSKKRSKAKAKKPSPAAPKTRKPLKSTPVKPKKVSKKRK